MTKILTLLFPSWKAKENFEEKINDGRYVIQCSNECLDGRIKVVYKYEKYFKKFGRKEKTNEGCK